MEFMIKVNSIETETYEGEVVLEELQKAVGGLIEVVYLQDAIMIINQEGLVHGLQYNMLASEIAIQPIVGNVVLLTHESVEKLK